MYKDLFTALATEGAYLECATESADGNKRNFFQKICDAVLWFLGKVKELVLNIIGAIKRFFTHTSPGSKSIISSALREYKTSASKLEKLEKGTSEVLVASNIPGLNGNNVEPSKTVPPTKDDIKRGEKVLEASLISISQLYDSQFKTVINLMGEVIRKDDAIAPKQISLVNSIKDMTGSLMSTEPIQESSLSNIKNLKEDIEKTSNEINASISDFLKTSKDNDKIKTEQIAKPIQELNPSISTLVFNIFKNTVTKMITAIKNESPNFQQYLQKIEAHAENYKKWADQLTQIITDVKNSVKCGSTLNEKTDSVLNDVQSVAKSNMALNNAFIKVMNIAKITTF